jgi:hypothetical protein
MQANVAARRTAALLAASLVVAGCATAVHGTAVPAGQSANPDNPAAPSSMLLRQQPGSGPPRRFGGVSAYDACSVLPLDVVAKSGFVFDLSLGERNTVKSAHLSENADDDPNGRGETSDNGMSECQYPGLHDLLLTFRIHQAPFDSPETQDAHERSLRHEGAVDGEVAGFRTLHVAHSEPIRSEATMIFGPGFYATVDLLLGTAPPPGDIGAELVRQAAERLHAAPAGPSTYSYEGDFAHVRPPCEIFTSADFRQALGFGTDGRPVEGYGLARSHTVPDPGSGTAGQVETFEVLTSCKQENQAAANSGVGSTPAQGITLEFTNYLTEEMATQANAYDCALDKGYRHPFGEPKKVPFSVGDGLSCLINMGGSVQSPLAFKSGRTTVEMSVFSVANLKDDATGIRVYSTVAQAVATELAGR